jgi:hypothetical protein
VKLSVAEVIKALSVSGPDADFEFVELPGDDGAILVRPGGVIAVIEDAKRSTAGFRVAQSAEAS